MAVGAPLTQKPKGLPARETAVVFVHGMGSQRRHEDSAKLAERLDEFTQSSGMGLLRGLKPEIEPSEFIPAGYATALRGRFLDGGQFGDPEDEKRATRDGRTFKFYEAYWAPITADEVPKWTVVRWMFSRVPKPIIATRAPWRHRSRFRRSLLLETDEIDGDVRSRLYELYDEFEGHPSRRKYPDGNFEEFKHFLLEFQLERQVSRNGIGETASLFDARQ